MKRINIPEGVKIIGNAAFKGCTNLIYIEIPDSVETIDDGAFYGCSSLKEIKIGTGIKRIGNGAFGFCSSLGYVTIEAKTPPVFGPFTFTLCFDPLVIQVPFDTINIYKNITEKGWGTLRFQSIR